MRFCSLSRCYPLLHYQVLVLVGVVIKRTRAVWTLEGGRTPNLFTCRATPHIDLQDFLGSTNWATSVFLLLI